MSDADCTPGREPCSIAASIQTFLHYYHYYLIRLAAVFLREPCSAISSWGPPAPPVLIENLGGLAKQGILCDGCPSCFPTVRVKAVKGTQSTDPSDLTSYSSFIHNQISDDRSIAV